MSQTRSAGEDDFTNPAFIILTLSIKQSMSSSLRERSWTLLLDPNSPIIISIFRLFLALTSSHACLSHPIDRFIHKLRHTLPGLNRACDERWRWNAGGHTDAQKAQEGGRGRGREGHRHAVTHFKSPQEQNSISYEAAKQILQLTFKYIHDQRRKLEVWLREYHIPLHYVPVLTVWFWAEQNRKWCTRNLDL